MANKITFSAQMKSVQSYASVSGDKTYTITLRGEDARMAECIALPGDCLVEVTVDVKESQS